MLSITDKSWFEQSSIRTVTAFYKKYRLGTILKNVGAYKQKGILVSAIVQYLISLVFIGKSMYQDMRSNVSLAQGFSKDTVYRFMSMISVNWRALLLRIAVKVVADMDKLTSDDRRCAIVVDDTMYEIPYAKKTELVSKVYDHSEKGGNKYKWGFRMLTLTWTDGVSLIPLAFRHLASSDIGKQRCESKPNLDKRSRAYRIRKEAVSKAPEVMLEMLKAAIKAGISAKYALFDSWFAFPSTIIKVRSIGLHVVARVKDTPKLKYTVGGVRKTAKEIFNANRKRRGRSRYLLSALIELRSTENGITSTLPARLVYVRNKYNLKEWIALITTDLSLSEEEVITLYGKRWDTEPFYKICKFYLKLAGEFQQLSYDAITAHTTIVMIRYMILSIEKRQREDFRSLGEIFFHLCDEALDIKFELALLLLIFMFAETLRESDVILNDEYVNKIMNDFINKLPNNIQQCLLRDVSV